MPVWIAVEVEGCFVRWSLRTSLSTSKPAYSNFETQYGREGLDWLLKRAMGRAQATLGSRDASPVLRNDAGGSGKR